MLASVENKFGHVNVLVNNPGTILVGPMEHMTIEDFQEVMRINFWGAVHTTLGVLPSMRERHQGRIVNITSIGGKVAFPHLLPYTASKFALVGFSRKTDRPGVSERGERLLWCWSLHQYRAFAGTQLNGRDAWTRVAVRSQWVVKRTRSARRSQPVLNTEYL
jgi:short subunit dehydrogenase